ncbi:MAG: zinc ribbon domain-containing protein [Leptolinea sp.]|nr:zinc ribbon domain-containing protein [Leptolinea sp.]
MARKEIGYVELEWTCPSCKTRNPGLVKNCQGCGAPQPADVEFQPKADQTLIQDAAKLEKAKKGPDIHCGFCGARNEADAVICSQCGGDIKEGMKRQAGKVMGELKTGTETKIKCPHCNAENPANAQICSGCGGPLQAVEKNSATQKKGLSTGCLIVLGIVGLLVVIGIISLISAGMKKTDMVAQLTTAKWERVIQVEEFGPVQKEDWKDEIPYDGVIGYCSEESRGYSDSPTSNSVEVCGEPYTVDRGNGVAEVVQDCQYEIFDDYCEYTVEEWHTSESLREEGTGTNAMWPAVVLNSQQREGSRSENYELLFSTNGETYTYETSDYNLFRQAQPGSRWNIIINGFGSIVSLERVD